MFPLIIQFVLNAGENITSGTTSPVFLKVTLSQIGLSLIVRQKQGEYCLNWLKKKAPRARFSRRFSHHTLLNATAEKGEYKALYIGYNHPFDDNLRRNIIELEVIPKDHTDVIAMGEYLPFPNESFDLVVISQVIEHTQYPFKVVDESYRVLKQRGILYIASPWCYPFHGNDNYRFSEEGLKILCSKFRQIEIGSLDGPLHTLAIFLYHFIIESLSFQNKYLRYGLSFVIGWLLYPIFVMDALTNRQKKIKYVLDANIYAVARK